MHIDLNPEWTAGQHSHCSLWFSLVPAAHTLGWMFLGHLVCTTALRYMNDSGAIETALPVPQYWRGVIVHEEHDRHAQPQITSQALLTQTAHLLYTFIHLWVYLGSSWCSLTSTHSRVKHLIVPNVCTGMHAEHSSRWTQRLYIDSFCIIPYVLIINFVQNVKKLCFLFWMPKCVTSIITLPSVICDAER